MQELPPREMILAVVREKSATPSVSRQFLRRLEIQDEKQDDED
jgi:hypothetical protein